MNTLSSEPDDNLPDTERGSGTPPIPAGTSDFESPSASRASLDEVSAEDAVESLEIDEDLLVPDGWADPDIEAAYLRAVQALEAADWVAAGPSETEAAVEGQSPSADAAAPQTAANTPDPEGTAPSASGDATPPLQGGASDPNAVATRPSFVPGVKPLATVAVGTPADGVHARGSVVAHPARAPSESEPGPLLPQQVLEALLFVGGSPLTAKRLAGLLGGAITPAGVEELIDERNRTYAHEERPYEIRLGEGGYRLDLRPEHERIRHRVYGIGPREVKLSQDALEILALIAYRQPVLSEQIETCGKPQAMNLVRQLVRRELVAVVRGGDSRADVRFCTTPRFLSLFGLSSLADLPRTEDVEQK